MAAKTKTRKGYQVFVVLCDGLRMAECPTQARARALMTKLTLHHPYAKYTIRPEDRP